MFDFDKAINGEPIYLNGKQVFPEWSIKYKEFSWGDMRFNRDGVSINYLNQLSTDPPKKKVKVTAYVYKNIMGDILFTNIPTPYRIGEISGEVEI